MQPLNRIKRDQAVDCVKFLSIYLICIFHTCNTSNFVKEYFAVIGLPTFFFVSALFDKTAERDFKLTVINSAKHLLVPYFVFSLLSLSICWISPTIHPELYPGFHSLSDCLVGAIKGTFLGYDAVTLDSFLPNEPLWFLTSLFCVKVMFSALFKSLQSKRIIWLVIIAIGIFIVYKYDVRYFGLLAAIYGLIFYVAGFIYRRIHTYIHTWRGYSFWLYV